ncbi:hypothetical protein DVH24_014639 [Malus domestica]|uniref:Uncharacterized protein n=1 Tax=Malus domestica TaxID=3750 RepID=A0A498KSR3_MALDO|nr:hypothetical protein DVH24_014639 [Malus domestica]
MVRLLAPRRQLDLISEITVLQLWL